MDQTSSVSALPIFPGRRQPSIFGASELNCRVRDGNGWTLTAISTDLLFQLVSQPKSLLFPWSVPTPGEWYTFRDSNPGHPD